MVTIDDGWASLVIPVKWRASSGGGFDPAPVSCALPTMMRRERAETGHE
jgi:hypothetical protein